MEIWSVIRNASEVHSKTNQTPYKFRYKEDFPYELIPLGAELHFKPESPKDIRKLNKYNEKMLPGIMLGYKMLAGNKPSGDTLILEREDIENATTPQGLFKRRAISLQQVSTVKVKQEDGSYLYRFPLATGDWKQPQQKRLMSDRKRQAGVKLFTRHDAELETPDTDCDEEDKNMIAEILANRPRFQEPSPNELKSKHGADDPEDPDTWSLSDSVLIRHINKPRTTMCGLQQDDCPIPLEYVDILRRTETDIDAKQEKTIRDFWTTEDADRAYHNHGLEE